MVIWGIGWLITLGFCGQIPFWKCIYLLFTWPFFVGEILHEIYCDKKSDNSGEVKS